VNLRTKQYPFMLENSFYNVEKTESTEDTLFAEVLLNVSHEIYKVHFPGNPVTPGVCLLQIALELLNLKFQRKLRLVSARNIKYLKVLFKTENDLIFADINITVGETVFTRISATYK
jgi:3-hydroxyacyl-[acyl-carrier-protein] dehydratase